jgi:glycosyltransferase involved in cell wall biosynthesis
MAQQKMNIAIDISPLTSGHFLQHRVRGTGFYLTNLKESLLKYYPENNYTFFKRGDNLSDKIDIIHYPYFEPFFLTLPIKKNKKTIVTVHDLTPLVFKEKFPSGVKGKLKWEVQKKSLKNADRIITDSLSSKKDIHKYVGIAGDDIDVVYLAAAKHFKNGSKNKEVIKKFKLPNEFVLYVGDATWNKNLPNLINATNKTKYSLVIAGGAFVNKDFDKSNPWNQSLHEAQVLASQNEKIIPLGFVSDEDLVMLYNSATAFIMPSFYEGFGLPILEAMQSGCPVITTREGSLEEVADSAAYFVDPYSIDSIADGINEVMSNNSLRAALAKKGLNQAKKFTWENTAKGTIEAYERVLNG